MTSLFEYFEPPTPNEYTLCQAIIKWNFTFRVISTTYKYIFIYRNTVKFNLADLISKSPRLTLKYL